MAKKQDQQVLQLIEQVKTQRAEIEKAEKPNWLTNCSYPGTKNTNLRVENDVFALVRIAGELVLSEECSKKAALEIGVSDYVHKISGYVVKDWLSDIKTRVSQIQILEKKEKLRVLEERLNKIISPELRTQLELEAISKELT